MVVTREDLLQTLIDRMNSVMRLVRHQSIPSVPILSPPHAHVLFTISMKEEGVSVKDLAEIIGVTPGAITQFVNTLVERDLVLREDDPNDRRLVRLKLTQTAKEQFKQLRKDYLASATRLFGVVSNEELQLLIDIFSRMDTNPEFKFPVKGA